MVDREIGFPTWLGSLMSGIAAISAVCFAAYSYFGANAPNASFAFYRMEASFVARMQEEMQTAFERARRPRIAANDCYNRARRLTSIEAVERNGEVLVRGYFLMIENSGEESLTSIEIRYGAGELDRITNVAAGESVLVCYQLEVRGSEYVEGAAVEVLLTSIQGTRLMELETPSVWTVEADLFGRGIVQGAPPAFR